MGNRVGESGLLGGGEMALERIQPFHLASFDPSLSLSVSPPQKKKKKKQYASDTLDTHQSMKRTIRKSKQVVQESESEEEEEIVVSVLFLLYSFFEREREREVEGRRREKRSREEKNSPPPKKPKTSKIS
jgi:hypothetical protein